MEKDVESAYKALHSVRRAEARRRRGLPPRPDGPDLNEPAEDRLARANTACFVRWNARPVVPGSGGAPLSKRRPQSAPVDMARTERWRESGSHHRWPHNYLEPVQCQSDFEPVQRRDAPDHTFWGARLWSRALRNTEGHPMEDPMYHNMGGGTAELAAEWRRCTASPPAYPYSGVTNSGRAAKRPPHDMSRWVERPVSTGKYSPDHFGGQRYIFDTKKRLT